MARGDYLYTVGEVFGIGTSTTFSVVLEVAEVIVKTLWEDVVNFPNTDDDFRVSMESFERLWQYPYCFGAIDGCHLPIKCPPGSQEAAKEYRNFKIFYSIVLMGIVDSNYKFIWASCGIPGNTHESAIFQSSQLYFDITEHDIIPRINNTEDGVDIHPMLIGDSAFPFRTWLLKPYTKSVLDEHQRYFNYRLSRARMVTECAYGQLKGRWRFLLRKSESKKDNV